MKFEKRDPPTTKPVSGTKYKFEEMEDGDTFYVEGVTRNALQTSFGMYCAKGRYTIRKEGKGWRFYLLKQKDRT